MMQRGQRYRNNAGAEIELDSPVIGSIDGLQLLGAVWLARDVASGFTVGSRWVYITPDGIERFGYKLISESHVSEEGGDRG